MNKANHVQRLGRRAVKGGFWVFTLRITQQIFSLTRLVILARVLAPHDFGLLGIAMLTLATLETFSRVGFDDALVQKKDDIKDYLNTAWTVSVFRGIILFISLYLAAPYAAAFFETSEATPIIQVIGISFLFQGFTNVGVIFFQKELEFKKQYIYQLSGTLADFIVAVSAALILGNVWALVYGLIAGNLVRLVVSYFVHSHKPTLSFDLKKAKELFGFGKWVLGSSILIFLITQGDDIFVGKFLGATALGFYQLAYRLSNLPATEITHVITQVTFPAYSKMQNNIPRLREAYLKVLQLTAFLSFPIAGMIFILTPEFTLIFLGEKWIPMVPAMQILVFAGLVRSIAATTGPIFHAVGKPEIDTKLQIIRLSVLAALIYPFTVNWGITGTSYAVLLSISIANIGFCFMAIKITNCGISKFFKIIILPLVHVSIVVSLMMTLKTSLGGGLSEFIIIIFIGLLMYLLVAHLSDKLFNYNIKALIKESVKAAQGI